MADSITMPRKKSLTEMELALLTQEALLQKKVETSNVVTVAQEALKESGDQEVDDQTWVIFDEEKAAEVKPIPLPPSVTNKTAVFQRVTFWDYLPWPFTNGATAPSTTSLPDTTEAIDEGSEGRVHTSTPVSGIIASPHLDSSSVELKLGAIEEERLDQGDPALKLKKEQCLLKEEKLRQKLIRNVASQTRRLTKAKESLPLLLEKLKEKEEQVAELKGEIQKIQENKRMKEFLSDENCVLLASYRVFDKSYQDYELKEEQEDKKAKLSRNEKIKLKEEKSQWRMKFQDWSSKFQELQILVARKKEELCFAIGELIQANEQEKKILQKEVETIRKQIANLSKSLFV
jgi:hypothetical protein